MRAEVSFIVAIYNVEPYLPACLDSLLRSDLTACEVLLIDDGSTDRCGALCDTYAKDYACVSAYHKPNGGLSDARNFGVSHSRGEWVIFIDGDDRVKSEVLSQYLDVLRGMDASVDVVFNDYIINNLKTGRTEETRQIVPPTSVEKVLRARGAIWNAWRYAYRKSFIVENGLSFKAGWLAEDLDLTTRVFSLPDLRIAFVHLPYYMYTYNRRDSVTATASFGFMECMTKLVRGHCRALGNRKDRVSVLIKRKLVSDYVRHAAKYYQFQGAERKKVNNLYRADGSPVPFNVTVFAGLLWFIRRLYHIGR